MVEGARHSQVLAFSVVKHHDVLLNICGLIVLILWQSFIFVRGGCLVTVLIVIEDILQALLLDSLVLAQTSL